MEQQSEGHIVSVENRKKITATQIDAVESFSPTQLVLSFAGGRIVVSGSEMKITSFSRSGGTFSASGTINSVKYVARGMNLKQRLFK